MEEWYAYSLKCDFMDAVLVVECLGFALLLLTNNGQLNFSSLVLSANAVFVAASRFTDDCSVWHLEMHFQDVAFLSFRTNFCITFHEITI